jgi:hypothetical protein
MEWIVKKSMRAFRVPLRKFTADRSLHPVKEEREKMQQPDFLEDFDNCKGQCGYTPWCKACMESRKEAEKLIQGTYTGNWPDEQDD